MTKVRERSTTPDDYQASYDRIFTKMAEMQHAKSFGKKITPLTVPERGPEKAQQLTDGIFGSWESWSAPDVHWVAYKGEHMDFILDLGENHGHPDHQYGFSQCTGPTRLESAGAALNMSLMPRQRTEKIFSDEVKVRNPNNPNPKENPDISKVPVQSFRADLGTNVKARYIKVHGGKHASHASWHIRAGNPAWIYTDQIMVE